MKYFFLSAIGFFLFFVVPAKASVSETLVQEHAKLRLVTAGNQHTDKQLLFGVEFFLEPGWKIYWKEAGDTGVPPVFDWKKSHNLKIDTMYWPVPHRTVDTIEGKVFESYTYDTHVLFPVYATLGTSQEEAIAHVDLSYAICKDLCILAQASLSLSVPVGHHDAAIEKDIHEALMRSPQKEGYRGIYITDVQVVAGNLDNKEAVLQVVVNKKGGFSSPGMFAAGGEAIAIAGPEIVPLPHNKEQITLRAPIRLLTSATLPVQQEVLLMVVDGNQAIEKHVLLEIPAVPAMGIVAEEAGTLENVPSSVKYSLWYIVLLAVTGGFILNGMPCVLPVLAIKLLGIIKHGGKDTHYIRMSLLSTAAGIAISFSGLASIVIAIKAGGQVVGWGFHFQEPKFLITLLLVVTLFAANLWGLFTIQLPSWLNNKLGNITGEESKGGHFSGGVLATLLATPCSAPFLGTAVGFALLRGNVEIIIVFLAMALGLALPYLLLSIKPAWMGYLPKPGQWIQKVKWFLGALLLITAVWLISILSSQMGKQAGYVLAIIVTSIMFSFLPGFWKTAFRRKLVFCFLVISSYTVPFHIAHQFHGGHALEQEPVQNGIWQTWKQATVTEKVKEGKVVIIDVTAEWCLTCKANEILVLSSPEIKAALSAPDVIAMRADWTNKNEEITEFLRRYGRIGIPFNIVYGPAAPEGIVLSELLSRKEVLAAIDKARGTR